MKILIVFLLFFAACTGKNNEKKKSSDPKQTETTDTESASGDQPTEQTETTDTESASGDQPTEQTETTETLYTMSFISVGVAPDSIKLTANGKSIRVRLKFFPYLCSSE